MNVMSKDLTNTVRVWYNCLGGEGNDNRDREGVSSRIGGWRRSHWDNYCEIPPKQGSLALTLYDSEAQTDLALQFANIMASREKATKFISEEEWNLREELRMAIRQINRPDPTLKKTPYPAERYMRDCAYCGNQFDRRGTTKLYCSPKCHNKALYQKRKQK